MKLTMKPKTKSYSKNSRVRSPFIISLLGLGVFLLLTSPALAVIPSLFVCANGATWVTAVNPNTGQTQRITVGDKPIRIAMLPPNGAKAYVSNHQTANVSVIDTQSKTVTATIPVANGPQELTVSPDGNNLYVVHDGANIVEKIDTSSNMIVGSATIAGTTAKDVLVTPDNLFVFVANYAGNVVDIFRALDMVEVATILDAPGARRLAIAPGGNRVFVTDYLGDKVTVIKTGTMTKLKDIPVGHQPRGIVIKPDGSEIWVTNVNPLGTVSVISNSSLTVTHTINVGDTPWHVIIPPSPNDGYAYVSNSGSNLASSTVSIIDTATYTVTKTLTSTDQIGDGPFFSVVDSGNQNLWLSNSRDIFVSEIGLSSQSVIRTVNVVDVAGQKPFDLMFSTP
jgi:YVTN family beta-propeller protein